MSKVGYRLWSFEVKKDNKELLREFIEEFRRKTWLYLYSQRFSIDLKINKYTECYVPELSRVLWNNVLAKGNGSIKINPLLRVRIVENGVIVAGGRGGPVVFDLSKREVRFQRKVIALMPESTTRAIKEDIQRFKLKFIVQFTEKKIHLIAFHDYRRPIIDSMPFLIITIDVNSRHGFTVRGFLFRSSGVSIVARLSLRPCNHSLRWKEIRKLQHLYDVSGKYEYYKLLKAIHSRIKRLNGEFKKRVVHELRKIIRCFNVPTVIIVDVPYDWGLRNTSLQRTLLKAVKAIRNMAYYENCIYIEKRASGKKCPLCGSWMREYKKTRHTRLYQCNQCNLIIDRDINTCYRLGLWVLKCFLKKPELAKVFREKIKHVKVPDGF